MKPGKLITFEGGEGSGKSSILKKISEELQKRNIPFIITREPGGTKISEEIRSIILDKQNTAMDKKTEALLYCASRRQHLVEKVFPSLEKGINVISDRYIDSSLVYQGYARGLGFDSVMDINLFAIDNRLPDKTLYFSIRPEVGLARINKNSNREVNRLDLENLEFHNLVHDGYEKLAKLYPDRIIKIDAEKTFDANESVINIHTIPMINGITTIPELTLAPQIDNPPNEEKKLDDTITF